MLVFPDWLTTRSPPHRYVPQLGDRVIYAIQGHTAYLESHPSDFVPLWDLAPSLPGTGVVPAEVVELKWQCNERRTVHLGLRIESDEMPRASRALQNIDVLWIEYDPGVEGGAG